MKNNKFPILEKNNFDKYSKLSYKINYKIFQEPKPSKKSPWQINIFTNYGEVIKDKECEKEISLWEKADEEDEEELSKEYS